MKNKKTKKVTAKQNPKQKSKQKPKVKAKVATPARATKVAKVTKAVKTTKKVFAPVPAVTAAAAKVFVPLAKSAKSAKAISGDFKQYQEMLLQKRDDILKMAKSKETDLSYGDIGDEGDVASQTFEREMMFEFTNSERMILDDVEAALRRIEKNEFGICEACRRTISAARLKAMPWARCCIDCQSRTEAPRV